MITALLLVIVAAVSSQRDLPPQAGAVSGRVTEKDSGRPLPGVVVTLGSSDRTRDMEDVTDDDGRYTFANVPPGTYGVWARLDEHRSIHLGQAFGVLTPIDPLDGPPRRGIEVKAGDRLTEVNVALGRALAIEGRVTDFWDEPMANVDLTAARIDSPHVGVAVAVTDDRGIYRIFGLAPGTYIVCAAPEPEFVVSGEPARYARTCHPAAVAQSQAADVVLDVRDAGNIDIRAQVRRVYTVTGSVVDASGAPAAGAWISALALDDDSPWANTKSGRSVFDGGAAFELGGVTPGRYIIFASIGGPVTPDDRKPARPRETGYAAVEVIASDVSGLVLTMSRDATVAGRVAFDGTPAPAAKQLRLVVRTRHVGRGADRLDRPSPGAAVDDRLGFQLTGLDRLPMAISVTGLPDGWAVKSIQHDGRDIHNAAIEFTSASAVSPLLVVLTNRVAQPSIAAADQQGNPMTDFYVVALPADRNKWKSGWFAELSSNAVSKLPALAPGDYLIAAVSRRDFVAFSRNPDRLPEVAAVATPMTFAEGDRRKYELRLSTLPPRP